MIRALRQLAARSRLIKARRELEAAHSEHKAACARRDSRSIHAATTRVQAANRAVLAAEIVAHPIPHPMPRHGAAHERRPA